ncbi:MAG: SAM-dependent methyltransferase [Rhodospirillales bacterium]|nr:SAM-dependent methyltransferase [Rhodospirillales bacterium]
MSKNETSTVRIFDRRTIELRRKRATTKFSAHDFMFKEVAERLIQRITDVKRKFGLTIDLGARTKHLKQMLSKEESINNIISFGLIRDLKDCDLIGNEEVMPFKVASADLLVSNLVFHWTNDLVGTLIQCRQILKPDGLFLAALFGGNTLTELRQVMVEVENEISGGVWPRISPLIQLPDAAALLQRSGYNLPVADTDTITVTYSDAFSLMRDLRGMGETNATLARKRHFSKRSIFSQVAKRYHMLFADSKGRIPATFQIIYLTGWAPDEAQPLPLKPGTATQRLADALDSTEQSAGDTAKPKI